MRRLPSVSPWLLALLLSTAPCAALANAALLEQASGAAHERGGDGAPLVKRAGRLRADSPVRTTLSVPAGACVVAVLAVAKGEASLGLRALAADLTDADAGELARLRYCAAEREEKVELSAESSERGPFVVGAWRVGAPEPEKVAVAPVPAAPAPPTESLSSRLGKLTHGYEPMAPPREEDLSEGDPRKRELVLEAGRCYRAFAVGEVQAGQLELLLRNVRGSGLRSVGKVPLGAGSTARTGLVCPQQTEPHVLEIRLRNGSGVVLWQLVGMDNPEISKRWLVGGEGQALVHKKMRSERARTDADRLPAMAFVTGALKTNEHAEAKFSVVPGRCYGALTVGVPSLRALELELYDQRGDLVAQTRGDSVARTQACAAVGGEWSVKVRAFKGYGDYGLQVFAGSED